MSSRKGGAVEIVTNLAQPVAKQLDLMIWDVEFVKEGASWYLRIYIDKDGGVTIDDCENFNRLVEPLIDEADPIDQSYFLEISSPGIERELKKPWHFEKMKGSQIKVRLIRPNEEGKREITGVLTGYENGVVKMEANDRQLEISQSDCAFIRILDEDLYFGGND